MWEQFGSKKLQLVSTRGVGWFAAHSFLWPEAYSSAVLTLMGDGLTHPETDGIYRKGMGQPMARAACPIASAVKRGLKGSVSDIFKCSTDDGMQDFEACL
ncbi:uncharacterized protein DNG_01603 [Cephalotrichum gorgonifer]|uniref:Uncharacterized protein n=1 Tax=Cephalotrichum gorgonifer TaxID=2041049 RepID=A0AAE8MRU8_9PEZI|nr:uncharacterized protein DNG_01603 [Cephalotrichum gorgonifer]